MKTLARLLLGGFLAFAGVSHLTFARDDFQAQVPNSIPLDEDFVRAALEEVPQQERPELDDM